MNHITNYLSEGQENSIFAFILGGGDCLTKLTKSIEIEAPPEKVWAFLTDIGKINEAGKGFAEYEQTSKGPMGVGTTMHIISKAGGSQIETDMEVTEFEKNKKLSMHTIGASKFKMEQIVTVEPTAKGPRRHLMRTILCRTPS